MNVSVLFKTRIDETTVLPKDDPRWRKLHKIVSEKSLKRGDFTLSSGRKSPFLFQLRQTTMHPEGQHLLGDVIVDYMRRLNLHCVGGLELGAVPLVMAIAAASYQKRYAVAPFFVRKEPKQHGARERIDGYLDRDAEVLIVDDVTTTGGSILKAIEGARTEGLGPVQWALSVVDREEGATENLAAHGIKLVSLFRRSDFI